MPEVSSRRLEERFERLGGIARLAEGGYARFAYGEAERGATEAAAGWMREAGLRTTRLPSGALHDATNMARICPIGMIFVRCREGISHNPAEFASPEDLADGARLLAGTLSRLARTR